MIDLEAVLVLDFYDAHAVLTSLVSGVASAILAKIVSSSVWIMKMSGNECCSLLGSAHAGSFQNFVVTLAFLSPCICSDVQESECT